MTLSKFVKSDDKACQVGDKKCDGKSLLRMRLDQASLEDYLLNGCFETQG
jgi:hypothetical protein